MVQQFLFGIYGGIFAVTTYTYHHRQRGKISPSWIINGTVIMLYILTAIVVLLDWKFMNFVFCDQVDSIRFLVYEVAAEGPVLFFNRGHVTILFNIAQFGGFILADGLLVWRCYHACGSSFYRAFLPIGLLVVEAGLVICAAVYNCVPLDSPPFRLAQDHHAQALAAPLAGAALISAAMTSMVSTLIICRQIYKYTSIRISKSRYKLLLLTLIQSSGAYSVTVCVKAILEFTDHGYISLTVKELYDGSVHVVQLPIATSYSSVIINVIVGLVPTLMVASVSLSGSHNDNEVFSGSFSFPLDIDLGEPQFATQPELTSGANLMNSVTEDLENGHAHADSQTGPEMADRYSETVSGSKPPQMLRDKMGDVTEETWV